MKKSMVYAIGSCVGAAQYYVVLKFVQVSVLLAFAASVGIYYLGKYFLARYDKEWYD